MNVAAIVDDLLFGPTIEDIQHMIEPNGRRRLLKRLTCEHKRRDWVRCMCLDCGVTDSELRG